MLFEPCRSVLVLFIWLHWTLETGKMKAKSIFVFVLHSGARQTTSDRSQVVLKNAAYPTNMLHRNLESPKRYKPFCFKASHYGYFDKYFQLITTLFLCSMLKISWSDSVLTLQESSLPHYFYQPTTYLHSLSKFCLIDLHLSHDAVVSSRHFSDMRRVPPLWKP